MEEEEKVSSALSLPTTQKTKKVLKTKTRTLEELVLELQVELLAHLFVANWQQDMFNLAKQLPCSSTLTLW